MARKRSTATSGQAQALATVAQARGVVSAYLSQCVSDGGALNVEPRDVAALASASARLLTAECEASERDERRRQARLTREKTRADTDLSRARASALGALGKSLEGATDEELEAIAAILDRIKRRG